MNDARLSRYDDLEGSIALTLGATNYAAQIYALDDDDLERLVDDWVASMRKRYPDSDRFSGAGDMGRDVVGYRSSARFDGLWDNYQCKQLKKALGETEFLRELAKIFFHSEAGNFSLPAHFYFVAPKGAVRSVKALVTHPSKIGPYLIERWDDCCAKGLVEKKTISLTTAIRDLIDSYDFKEVSLLEASKLVRRDDMKQVLVKWFGADPGEAPGGEVPTEVQPEETSYISQLLRAYHEMGAPLFSSGDQAVAHGEFGKHFSMQRERFFDAAAFKRYYRDSTEPVILQTFEKDIFHGVFDTHELPHSNTLSKIAAVMTEAKNITVSGVLSKYARVPVKQGVVHHFVNDGALTWIK